VVNLIEFEDLHDVVLLGHSYASLVVTGAADRIPECISQLVYLDTAPLPDVGERLSNCRQKSQKKNSTLLSYQLPPRRPVGSPPV